MDTVDKENCRLKGVIGAGNSPSIGKLRTVISNNGKHMSNQGLLAKIYLAKQTPKSCLTEKLLLTGSLSIHVHK